MKIKKYNWLYLNRELNALVERCAFPQGQMLTRLWKYKAENQIDMYK